MQLGVEVVVNARVNSVDPYAGSITLADGTQISGDLIIGADGTFFVMVRTYLWTSWLTLYEGIKSFVRPIVLKHGETSTVETGFAAYRATVDTSCLQDDPDTSWLLDKPELNLW